MTIGPRRLSSAVVPTYHLSFMFSGLLHIIVVMTLHTDITYSFSVSNCLSVNSQLATQISLINFCKRIPMAKKFQDNIAFTFNFTFCLSLLVLRTWLFVLLMSSGDIHPNPGPMSSVSFISSSTSSTNLSTSVFDSLRNLSRLYTLLSLDLFWNTPMSSGTTVLDMKNKNLTKYKTKQHE